MIQTLRRSAYKHGYLIFTAAWLYTLSFIIVNYWTYTSSPASVQKKFEQYLKKSEQIFDGITANPSALLPLVNDTSRPRQEFFNIRNDLNFYVYERINGEAFLSFWNTHVVVPLATDLAKEDGKYFVKYANGEFEFIKKTLHLRGKEIIAAGLIPIRHNYFWNNKYLRTEFAAFHELEERYDLDKTNKGIGIKNGDGIRIFSLEEKPKGKITYSEYDSLPLIIRLLGIIFLLIFINFIAQDIVRYHGWKKGFVFLVTVIFSLRLLTYYYNFPFDFRKLELFDELIYASSWLHRSLGDLLINTILAFWIITFLKSMSLRAVEEMSAVRKEKGVVLTAVLCIILLIISFGAATLIRSLIIDSNISFDVSNFFSLTVYTLLSFIILCFIILSYFYLTHIILLLIQKCVDVSFWVKYLFTAVLGLIYLSIHFAEYVLAVNIWLRGYF